MGYFNANKALLCGILALCVSLPVRASWGECPAYGKAADIKKSSPQRMLVLLAKNPSTWKVIPGGARGNLCYDERTGAFSFSARKLMPGTGYSLVRYAGSPPYVDLLVEGKANSSGELFLDGAWKKWTHKIWLIQSRDTAAKGGRLQFTAWHPERYLFEEKVLGIIYECNNKE